MTYKKINNKYVLRFDYGEEFISELTNFLVKQNIESAFFYGLGGAKRAVLGIYRIDTDHEYHWHDFDGPLEVTNISGNVAYFDDKRLIHAHTTISGVDFNASGGHVKELEVSGTLELFLEELPRINRKLDKEIGLGLLNLDNDEATG